MLARIETFQRARHQSRPFYCLEVGAAPRAALVAAPNRHNTTLVGITGPVIHGRASRALPSESLQPSRHQALLSSHTPPTPTRQLANRPASVRPLYSILKTPYSRVFWSSEPPNLSCAHLVTVPASDRPLYSILHTRYSSIVPCPRAPSARTPFAPLTSPTETASAAQPGPRSSARPSWPAFRRRPAPA